MTTSPFIPHGLTARTGAGLAFGHEIAKDALISECGQYRYYLTRLWDPTKPILIWIMLNPSTADADLDDPTIRRCMSFARQNDFGGILVLNLFAFRATQPADMKAAADPVGPANDNYLQHAFEYAVSHGATVICGWGAHGTMFDRDYAVVQLAEVIGLDPVCLGHTNAGCPKHPLYIKDGTPFVKVRRG
ncbi:hypothetical protein BAJUN_00110 [Bajunvirus bajun]|uniref:DUF1643 domain-containing protein n=1 Tax=Brevundimonas phage vB_BgoS-Bajun TaxID=2948594 RepID=A0A9E7N7F7_9CAUD|nr:hypothetical protein BAJUN_00110 [Brevundimonas phage vB_BgoS-Bajun]